MPIGLQVQDFYPITSWKPAGTICHGRILNPSSGLCFKKLDDDSDEHNVSSIHKWQARMLCAGWGCVSPIVNAALGTANLAYRVGKLVTLSHFWRPSDSKQTMRQRAYHALTDVARVLATPVCLLGLVASPLYGLFNPLDGIKLYSSFARALYGEGRLYKCAVPFPMRPVLRAQ